MNSTQFDINYLAHLIYKEKYDKWIKVQEMIAKDPILQNHVKDYGLSRSKLYEIYCRKAQRLHKLVNYSDEVIPTMVNSQFPETIVTVLHQTMFIPTIKNLGTEKQIERWIPKSENYEIIGCYAQTELGHGSDVQNLETTAVYDAKTEEFIINTPTVSATKWWIGDLGFTATHAVTHAQLFIDGKHYGVQTFIIQVRDVDTHLPLQGIEVGDVGAKYGYNTKDNGYMRMNNIRVPRENMLMRYSKVTKQGEFIKSQNEKIGYATMMQVRLAIIYNTYISLAQGLAISVKYSHFRKQFKDNNQIERPIIDYQIQQDKVTPLMSTVYAQIFACHKIQDLLHENLKRINEKMDFSMMGDLHALLCCCKAVFTWATHFGLDKLRQSLGGHGYLLSSGVATVQTEFAPSCTYEGENTVLLLQTARYLLKAHTKIIKQQHVNENVEYLINMDQTLSSKCEFTQMSELMYPENVRKILRFNSVFLIHRAFSQMMEKGAQFGPKDAWNKHCGIALTEAAVAHTHYFTFKNFMETTYHINEENIRQVMSKLCCLYGLQKIIEYPNAYYQGEYLNGDQLELIYEAKESLISQIKPYLIQLVDSFKFHDNALRSDLVGENPYQNLINSAKQSVSNEEQFQEKLSTLLNRIQSKQHAKL